MPLDEQVLERLFLANAGFEELERALDVFCPFEAMGVVRQEIRHGHYLRYICDPQRPHGFGADCLRGFMSAAAGAIVEGADRTILPLDVHLMDLDSALVRGEYQNIDIVIEIPTEKLVIAIELKIDASEHSGQLARYRKTVERDWPTENDWRHLFLFLTKRGDEPSAEHGDGWRALPLESLVSALESVLARGSGAPEARNMLVAYLGMLRRNHLSDQRLEELARRLWAQHKEALDFLAARRPDAASEIFALLSEDQNGFADQLTTITGLDFVPDHSTKTYLRFGIAAWDSAPGMLSGTGWAPATNRLLLFEIYRDTKGGIRCQFTLGPGDAETRTNLFEGMKGHGADVGGSYALYPKWRTLANKILMKPLGEDDVEIERKAELIRAGVASFVKQHVPRYAEAVRTALVERPVLA